MSNEKKELEAFRRDNDIQAAASCVKKSEADKQWTSKQVFCVDLLDFLLQVDVRCICMHVEQTCSSNGTIGFSEGVCGF
jgi:hypothetical protein